jgi:5,10-methenyltetrahydromethanopterin hydrogenase
LQADQLRAYDSDKLVLKAPADARLYDLLTKHCLKTRKYTAAAITTFKQVVELAGLPIDGRKSKKHQLIHGGLMYYHELDQLVGRLELLAASKQTGSTCVDNEISEILDELTRSGTIEEELAVQFNKMLLA